MGYGTVISHSAFLVTTSPDSISGLSTGRSGVSPEEGVWKGGTGDL